MHISLPQKRIVRFGIPLLLASAVAAALVITLSPKTEATTGTLPLTEMVEALKVDPETKVELETAIAALVERNGQAQILLDSTAGKVLDDAVRTQLQTDITSSSELVTGPFPVWQADAVALLSQIQAANTAYDASAPAVSANHEQWVIATTPPPPPPVVNNGGGSNKSSNGGGGTSRKPSSSGGGGSSNGGGGGGSTGGPSGGGWTDNGGGNGVWEQPVGPGTSFE